jgi:hypothetical protein
MKKANTNQIIKNIAIILKHNPAKVKQLEKVWSISENCTSDNHIEIICEMYSNNIVRYLITGTRSGMTITANALTYEIVRKRRNEKPWIQRECECWCDDIFNQMKEIASFEFPNAYKAS